MARFTDFPQLATFLDLVKTGVDKVTDSGVQTMIDKNLIIADIMFGLKTENPEGPKFEEVLTVAGPGTRVIAARTGAEYLTGGVENTKANIKLGWQFLKGAFLKGEFDLRMMARSGNPEMHAAKYLTDVVERSIELYHYAFEHYLLMGTLPTEARATIFSNILDMYGINTLCGTIDASSGGVDGANYGLIQFKTEATQGSDAQTTMGLARSDTLGWVNRYAEVGAGGLDSTGTDSGKAKIGRVAAGISQALGKPAKLVCIADADTYELAEAGMNTAKVAIVNNVAVGDNLNTYEATLEYTPGITLRRSMVLDRASASFSGTDAADGLIYMMALDRCFRMEDGGSFKVDKSSFERIELLATTLALTFTHMWNWGCRDLRTLGAVTGTAR